MGRGVRAYIATVIIQLAKLHMGCFMCTRSQTGNKTQRVWRGGTASLSQQLYSHFNKWGSWFSYRNPQSALRLVLTKEVEVRKGALTLNGIEFVAQQDKPPDVLSYGRHHYSTKDAPLSVRPLASHLMRNFRISKTLPHSKNENIPSSARYRKLLFPILNVHYSWVLNSKPSLFRVWQSTFF